MKSDTVSAKTLFRSDAIQRVMAFSALIVLAIGFSLASPYFRTFDNLIGILLATAVNGVLGLGVTFIIITAGIDLSVGTVLTFSAVMTGVFITNWHLPIPLGILGGVLAGQGLHQIDARARILDDEIAGVLREVGLEPAVQEQGGLDTARNWMEVLSLEEQQRLSVARAVLGRPDFAFLAQLDSALGDEEQERFLKLFARQGIAYVSFGDRAPDSSGRPGLRFRGA
jgi:hypothetical protein